MSKRPNDVPVFTNYKRTKLNIQVVSNKPNEQAGTSSTHLRNNGGAKQDDMWGDDFNDEDVETLVLLSQAIEQIENDVQNISELPSFSDFRGPQSCSTQKSTNGIRNIPMDNPSKQNRRPETQYAANNHPFTKPMPKPLTNTQNGFKPSESSGSKSFFAKTTKPPTNFIPSKINVHNVKFNTQNIKNFNISTQSSNANDTSDRANLCVEKVGSDCKNNLQYFMQQLEIVKKENEKLKIDNGKFKNEHLTKEGEASILRSKLVAAEAAVNKAKIERVHLTEEFRLEHSSVIGLLNKQIQNLQSQLGFKKNEIVSSNDRCRLLESNSIRLIEPQPARMGENINLSVLMPGSSFIRENSQRPNSKTDHKNTTTTSVQTCRIESNRNKINQLEMEEYPLLNALPDSIFELSDNPDAMDIMDTENKHECLCVKSVLPDLCSLSKLSKRQLQSSLVEHHIDKIVCITFELALSAVHSLRLEESKIAKPLSTEYITNTKHGISSHNIYQPNVWDGEMLLELRRMFSVVSLIASPCTYTQLLLFSDSAMKNVLKSGVNWFKEHGRCLTYSNETNYKNLLEVTLKVITIIGRSNKALSNEGLLVAVVEMLTKCLEPLKLPENIDLLLKLIQQLVFCVPPPQVTIHLMSLLVKLSIKNNKALESLCSGSMSGIERRVAHGLLLFTPAACLLHVLSPIVETTIPRSYTSQEEYKVLHNFTSDIVAFLFNSIVNEVSWVYPASECLCLKSLMFSTVALLHMCVEQYDGNPHLIENQSYRMSFGNVLRLGIRLIGLLLGRNTVSVNDLVWYDIVYRCFIIAKCAEDLQNDLDFENIHRDCASKMFSEFNSQSVQTECPSRENNMREQLLEEFFIYD